MISESIMSNKVSPVHATVHSDVAISIDNMCSAKLITLSLFNPKSDVPVLKKSRHVLQFDHPHRILETKVIVEP